MAAYDYLIVGSGLYGATFAYCATRQGKKCLVIDKRPQLGGNVYCEEVEGIQVHKYLPYQQQGSVGLRELYRGIQPLYQLPGGQLQGGTLQPAVQYEHV